MKIKVGDIVKGISDRYSITTTKMTKAVVTKVKGSQIRIVIIEHLDGCNGCFDVGAEDFSVTGHVKEFNREEVLKSFETNKKALLEYNLQGADLQGANLRGANLRGADLQGANLRGANLQDANPQDANLRGANLQDANLWGADLQDADLQGANLRGANLQGAKLRGADLQDANLRGANLQDANLWGANLQGANLRGANLQDANLRGADLQDANLRGANLRGTDLRGANLRGADLQDADLDYAALSLSCNTLDVNVDDRQTIQRLYHLIRNALYSKNTSAEMKALLSTSALVEKANEFHRVSECGKIVVKKENKND